MYEESEKRYIIGQRGLPSNLRTILAGSHRLCLQVTSPKYKGDRQVPMKKTRPFCSKVVATICIYKISTQAEDNKNIFTANPLIRKIKPT